MVQVKEENRQLGYCKLVLKKKQSCIASLTAESEYIVAAVSAQQLVNAKGLLEKFKVNTDAVLYCVFSVYYIDVLVLRKFKSRKPY